MRKNKKHKQKNAFAVLKIILVFFTQINFYFSLSAFFSSEFFNFEGLLIYFFRADKNIEMGTKIYVQCKWY